MPFGLKNVGATCQSVLKYMFHDFIHVIMEVYVDEILVKYKRKEDHLNSLEVVFERMEKYNLRIKP